MAATLPISVTDLVRRDFLELYEIDGAAIGAGSMGEVFLAAPREAASARTGQIVGKIAVKVLHKQDDDNPEGEELPSKLKREVEMMAMAKGHTNVVKFMGLFMADHPVHSGKSWFLAMEYYSGGDLVDQVEKSCLSERSSQLLVKAMLGALDHLHGLGIVHRDVKADNILLTGTGATDQLGSDFRFSLGFLSNYKRTNVALSRAKSLLIVVGNLSLLSTDATWNKVIRLVKDMGGLRGEDFTLQKAVYGESSEWGARPAEPEPVVHAADGDGVVDQEWRDHF